jgi:hypothetical protein
MQEHSKVVDCVFEVAISELGNISNRSSLLHSVGVVTMLVREILVESILEFLSSCGRVADLWPDAKVLDLGRR